MSVSINIINNANVYLDGVNFVGQAGEIKLPEIENEFEEYKALGLIGTPSLPMGFKEMEGEIEWNSFDQRAKVKMYNPYKTVQLMVRNSVETYNAQGRLAELPLVTVLGVMFNKVGLGTYKPKELADMPSSFKIHSINQKLGGRELLHFDVFNNQLRVDGVDVLSQWRKNLGA